MGIDSDIQDTPNLILFGAPNKESLRDVVCMLEERGIGYSTWNEPDHDMGFTSLITKPIEGHNREAFAGFALWKPIRACSSIAERPVGLKTDGKMEGRFLPGAPSQHARLA